MNVPRASYAGPSQTRTSQTRKSNRMLFWKITFVPVPGFPPLFSSPTVASIAHEEIGLSNRQLFKVGSLVVRLCGCPQQFHPLRPYIYWQPKKPREEWGRRLVSKVTICGCSHYRQGNHQKTTALKQVQQRKKMSPEKLHTATS